MTLANSARLNPTYGRAPHAKMQSQDKRVGFISCDVGFHFFILVLAWRPGDVIIMKLESKKQSFELISWPSHGHSDLLSPVHRI